jgi:predicted nucleic acid-binding protein
MTQKILIDSDVCLDFLTGRKPHHNYAQKLFWNIENSELSAFVSPESFSNMFYVLRKFYSPQKIISHLKNLRSFVTIAVFSPKVIDSALDSGWNDFEDAIQYYSALESECNAIITRNTSDFKKSEIPVYTAYNYLNK